MMQLEIKTIWSTDVELESWRAESEVDVYFPVQFEIGEAGDLAADTFQVMVATPEALRSRISKNEWLLSDRATLVIANYTWPKLKQALDKIVNRCASEDWIQSVAKLQRYFQWEYEDYNQD